MDYLSILSSVAIFVFIVALLPEIRKLLKNKKARDISIWMSYLMVLGNSLMLIRAIKINDVFFVFNYAIQLVLWAVIIVLILKYRDR